MSIPQHLLPSVGQTALKENRSERPAAITEDKLMIQNLVGSTKCVSQKSVLSHQKTNILQNEKDPDWLITAQEISFENKQFHSCHSSIMEHNSETDLSGMGDSLLRTDSAAETSTQDQQSSSILQNTLKDLDKTSDLDQPFFYDQSGSLLVSSAENTLNESRLILDDTMNRKLGSASEVENKQEISDRGMDYKEEINMDSLEQTEKQTIERVEFTKCDTSAKNDDSPRYFQSTSEPVSSEAQLTQPDEQCPSDISRGSAGLNSSSFMQSDKKDSPRVSNTETYAVTPQSHDDSSRAQLVQSHTDLLPPTSSALDKDHPDVKQSSEVSCSSICPRVLQPVPPGHTTTSPTPVILPDIITLSSQSDVELSPSIISVRRKRPRPFTHIKVKKSRRRAIPTEATFDVINLDDETEVVEKNLIPAPVLTPDLPLRPQEVAMEVELNDVPVKPINQDLAKIEAKVVDLENLFLPFDDDDLTKKIQPSSFSVTDRQRSSAPTSNRRRKRTRRKKRRAISNPKPEEAGTSTIDASSFGENLTITFETDRPTVLESSAEKTFVQKNKICSKRRRCIKLSDEGLLEPSAEKSSEPESDTRYDSLYLPSTVQGGENRTLPCLEEPTIDNLVLPFDDEIPMPILKQSKSQRNRRRSADLDIVNSSNILASPVVTTEDQDLEIPTDIPLCPSGMRRSGRLRRKSLEIYRANARRNIGVSGSPEIDESENTVESPVSVDLVQETKREVDVENSTGDMIITLSTPTKDSTSSEGSERSGVLVTPGTEKLEEGDMLQTPVNPSTPENSPEKCTRRASSRQKRKRPPDTTTEEQTPPMPAATPSPLKRARKRKVSIEDIYLNKLWRSQMPKMKSWETIFEDSSNRCQSVKRFKRSINFEEFYTQTKLKRRRQKALKQGWKPMTNYKHKQAKLKVDKCLAALETVLNIPDIETVPEPSIVDSYNESADVCPLRKIEFVHAVVEESVSVVENSNADDTNDDIFYTPAKSLVELTSEKDSPADHEQSSLQIIPEESFKTPLKDLAQSDIDNH